MNRLIFFGVLVLCLNSAAGQTIKRTKFSSSSYRWSVASPLQLKSDSSCVAILRSGGLDIVLVDDPEESRRIWSLEEELKRPSIPSWLKRHLHHVLWSLESDSSSGSLVVFGSYGQHTYAMRFGSETWENSESSDPIRWNLPRVQSGYVEKRGSPVCLFTWGNSRSDGYILKLRDDGQHEQHTAPFTVQQCWMDKRDLLLCSNSAFGIQSNLQLSRCKFSDSDAEPRFSSLQTWNTAKSISLVSSSRSACAATTYPVRLPPQHSEYLFSGIVLTTGASVKTLSVPFKFNRLSCAKWSDSGEIVVFDAMLDLVGDSRSFQTFGIVNTKTGQMRFTPKSNLYTSGTSSASIESLCAVSTDGRLVFTTLQLGPQGAVQLLYEFLETGSAQPQSTEASYGLDRQHNK